MPTTKAIDVSLTFSQLKYLHFAVSASVAETSEGAYYRLDKGNFYNYQLEALQAKLEKAINEWDERYAPNEQ